MNRIEQKPITVRIRKNLNTGHPVNGNTQLMVGCGSMYHHLRCQGTQVQNPVESVLLFKGCRNFGSMMSSITIRKPDYNKITKNRALIWSKRWQTNIQLMDA